LIAWAWVLVTLADTGRSAGLRAVVWDSLMANTGTPRYSRARAVSAVLVLLAIVGFYFGWTAFWFLTDDAYIAFRYIGNRHLGFGYVWNPPPFTPVEGYTSFLWVALLDGIWTLTGVAPPDASNWAAFGFGILSLLLTTVLVWRMPLCLHLEPYRPGLLSLVLLGMITNATFLTWSSSGLETSLFNFFLLAWVAAAIGLRAGSTAWLLAVSATASLITLTRPDGLLFLAGSVFLIVLVAREDGKRPLTRRLLMCWPFVITAAHLLWRRSFYGEWLPNTYYAKHVASWPESGVRYALSYMLEYGLWLWIVILLTWILTAFNWRLRDGIRLNRPTPSQFSVWTIVATMIAHVSYYTFIIGGDHFEYRVYSHLVPLTLLSAVWMMNQLVARRRASRTLAVSALIALVFLSIPIPWSYWYRSRHLSTRAQTKDLRLSTAEIFPPGLRWYARWFDDLQEWLIVEHAVGKRWREHANYHEIQSRKYPAERVLNETTVDEFPVYALAPVGIPSWILARVNIIDLKGLNDHLIARTPPTLDLSKRRMAHDRVPPRGYVACFRPNVQVRSRQALVVPRRSALTADDINRCERTFLERLRRP
jgi:arabinofuranosyltransferase